MAQRSCYLSSVVTNKEKYGLTFDYVGVIIGVSNERQRYDFIIFQAVVQAIGVDFDIFPVELDHLIIYWFKMQHTLFLIANAISAAVSTTYQADFHHERLCLEPATFCGPRVTEENISEIYLHAFVLSFLAKNC